MEGEGLSLKQRDKYQLNGSNGESNGAARRSIGQATARGNGASQLNHEDQQYLNVVIHVISAEIMMLIANRSASTPFAERMATACSCSSNLSKSLCARNLSRPKTSSNLA